MAVLPRSCHQHKAQNFERHDSEHRRHPQAEVLEELLALLGIRIRDPSLLAVEVDHIDAYEEEVAHYEALVQDYLVSISFDRALLSH